MMTNFGPELDAEIAYRRETLALHGPTAHRGRTWISRLLTHNADPALATARRHDAVGTLAA